MKDAMFTAFPADPVGTRPGRVYLDDYPFREPPLTITPTPEFLLPANCDRQVVDKIDHHRS